MANLRTNNLSGEQGQNAYRGSVFFDGNSTGLRAVESDSNLTFGTGDFTIEFWILRNNSDNAVFLDWRHTTGGNQGVRITLYADGNLKLYVNGSNQISGSDPLTTNSWHHVALARASSSTRLFVNGVQFGSTYSDSGDYVGPQDSGGIYIGRFGGGSYDTKGYISNLRIVKGTALYTSDFFTPPQSELTLVDGTSVLCCQDSDDPTQDAAGTTITADGSLATAGYLGTQPKVIPPFGVDAGNTFGGPIQQSTQGYMCFPTGRTEERGRGRAVIMGGVESPNPYMTQIDFFTIPTMGNSLKFGDLSFGSRDGAGAVSSTNRAVYAGGMGPGSEVATNSMSFVTIATQGNGTDYGDLTAAKRQGEGCSNGVRGIFMGGENDSPSANTYNNVIDFCTIASIGNASDFGDLTAARDGGGVCSSPIRGVCGGGYDSGNSNVIDFVTIATTGNASDFGDLTAARTGATGCASATRGLFMGGRIAPNNKAEIDFITIASAGNASDFGDLQQERIQASATASQTRGVHIGGNPGSSPYNFTNMQFVTIASTGNASDFGETHASRSRRTASDCHGGLS